MSKRHEIDIDSALAELAADVAAATPRPDADLVARVLADAASVTAKAAVPRPEPAHVPAVKSGFSLREFLFGWGAGATAAAALGLMVGLGIGMQVDADLPMMAADEEPAAAFFSADAGFLPDDFL